MTHCHLLDSGLCKKMIKDYYRAMSKRALKNLRQMSSKGLLNLVLAFAVVLLLAHESQHDLPNGADVDTTQCEFCLKGNGPLGIAQASQADFTPAYSWHVRPTRTLAVISKYQGFSYTSRAPPVV